ncbi:MAG TPA: DUF2911 domain-containing protein [Gemmatimonadaceae bacterium]|nr:DUF2911 domain-containing protein [Gemmatimonadaceae bacterium]
MSVKRIILSAALLTAASVDAQTPAVTGMFVSTLGNDTIAIERYTRTGDKLEGDLLYRTPRARVVHYVADLTSDKKFKGLAVTTRRVGTDPSLPPVFSMTTLIGDTVATIDVQRNGRPDTTATGRRVFKGRVAPSVPGVPAAYGLFEQIMAFNPPAADTIVIATPGAGGGPTATLALARRSPTAVVFTSSFSPGWNEIVTVDANGRITAVDATATTVKTMTRRVDNLDFDAIAKRWAASEPATGAPLSAPDTARGTIGAARVEVAYSRPAKRGRVIFGTVVPWNQVWRTGANAATQFTTSADLMFGTTVVPAGKYTLWTLPTATGAKLIINSQTGQWGTEYDEKRDLVRLDLTQSRLAQPVEQFTIAVAPQGTGGVLRLQWDNTEYSVPFRLK